ncbi:MAG TPA: VWA domain-containing protein, partial [Gemmatimonadaceae bacterium]|nr:VWA domain-containing protein [Gemmatimonadaceae bacterium]
MASAPAMIDLRFISWPWALPLVVAAPLATGLMIAKARRMRAMRLAHLGTASMIARLAPTATAASQWQPVRLTLAVLFMAIAFAGPRWGVERTFVRQPGIDVVLALDASSSMLARDEKPDRLTAMKQTVERLRELSPNDRFALVAFAGRSYVLSPVTVDQGALNLFIDNLDPTIVGQSGSSIASALRQANNLLALSKSQAERAIIVMSDGEGFEQQEEVLAEARRAAEAGTTVISVGFGTEQGATIPVRENGAVVEKRDPSGAPVITHYSPDLLRAAAEAANGIFVGPGDADRAATVRGALARLRTEQRSMTRGTNLGQRFQLFLIPALFLLLLDSFLSTRRGRKRGLSAVATAAPMALVMITLSGCAGRGRDKEAIAQYNHGTAMLARPDSVKAAVGILKLAAQSRDSEVVYRAGFNAG